MLRFWAAPEQRRSGDFLERLSLRLINGALIGGFIVLFDFKFTLTFWGQVIQVGSGFAPETKGMVLQSMLISGFAAVVAFWLGTTKQGQEQSQAVNRIAESSPSSTAAAVAANVAAGVAGAAPGQPIPIVPVVTPQQPAQPGPSEPVKEEKK